MGPTTKCARVDEAGDQDQDQDQASALESYLNSAIINSKPDPSDSSSNSDISLFSEYHDFPEFQMDHPAYGVHYRTNDGALFDANEELRAQVLDLRAQVNSLRDQRAFLVHLVAGLVFSVLGPLGLFYLTHKSAT